MIRRTILTRAAAVTTAVATAAVFGLAGSAAQAAPAPAVNAANYVKYSLPGTLENAQEVVAGADGSMWFTDDALSIGRVSATGAITDFPIAAAHQYPHGLVVGSDGNAWFDDGPTIGRVTPAGVYTYFTPPSTGADVRAATLGPDGNIWFSAGDSHVDKITPGGIITQYTISGGAGASGTAYDLAPGPDGNLWVLSDFISGSGSSFSSAGHFGSITTDGVYTDHVLGHSVLGNQVVTGSDGDPWFSYASVDSSTSQTQGLGIATVAPSGLVVERPLGTVPSNEYVGPEIVAGLDGNLYESVGGQVDKVTTAGAITKTTVGAGEVNQLSLAPNGSISYVLGSFPPDANDSPYYARSVGEISTSRTVATLYSNSKSLVGALAWSTDGHLWFADGSDQTLGSLHPLNSTRVAGSDRYETAVDVAKAAYPDTAPVVFVATGQNYPDALSAAPAAAHEGGPLLLTRQDGVPADVLSEITSLAPSKIVVVGGTSAVSDTALQQLHKAAPTATVTRLGGATRFDTSLAITQNAFGAAGSANAFVATGRNFPDALAASSAAGKLGAPVILVSGDSAQTDSNTTGLITSLGATKVYIAGGTAAVSAGIESQLDTLVGTADVDRLQGANRYATSSAINHRFFTTASNVYLATGADYSDALTGAAVAGAQSAPLYLSQPTCLPAADATDIQTFGPAQVTLLGGTSALSAGVAALAHC